MLGGHHHVLLAGALGQPRPLARGVGLGLEVLGQQLILRQRNPFVLLRPLMLADHAVEAPVNEHAELGLVPPRHPLLRAWPPASDPRPWAPLACRVLRQCKPVCVRGGQRRCARRAKLLQKCPSCPLAPIHGVSSCFHGPRGRGMRKTLPETSPVVSLAARTDNPRPAGSVHSTVL